ncbi:hypothetical protein T265_01174 [Opisthorchis viverrini]|uniref:UspA domain-containing protein n=1 Tax=Opisthorchis viverrini TaxID=6198 RepID=A0A075AAR1_OPIVI|nr:hypothetical protein T265_01174 [Opisthorchis viverrini]KER32890.1 hypothetical protein T265_01174 [Opisthorchis viverrini]
MQYGLVDPALALGMWPGTRTKRTLTTPSFEYEECHCSSPPFLLDMMEPCCTGFCRTPSSSARSVLIAVDDSPPSKNAFKYYMRWLSRSDDAVTLYYALEPSSLPSVPLTNLGTIPHDEWSKIIHSKLECVRRLESQYVTDLQTKGLNYQFVYETADQVGKSIVSKAEKYRARLVVMGSRGLGALQRTLMGSVSDYVLHNASTAVCVIPHNVSIN